MTDSLLLFRSSVILDRHGMRSGKVDKEVARRHRKRLRQLHDVFEGHIPLATLHPADVIAMQFRSFGEFLLRVASLVAELPQRIAESRFDGACGHTPILEP